jgi:hypothetical protein
LRDSVISEIEYNIEKELPNIKDLSKQSQNDALANVLLHEQRELIEKGYLDAANRSIYTKALSNVIVKNPDIKNVIVEALQKALDIRIEEINNAYRNMIESLTMLKKHPSISKIEEGYSESLSFLLGYSEPLPSIYKEYAFQEESLLKPTQKVFLPMTEEQKPILLEPEEIQEGKIIPQGETGTGIPIGGARRRIRK